MSAADDAERFDRAKQLTSYCGIVPTVRPVPNGNSPDPSLDRGGVKGLRAAIVTLARKTLSLAFYFLRNETQHKPLRLKQATA